MYVLKLKQDLQFFINNKTPNNKDKFSLEIMVLQVNFKPYLSQSKYDSSNKTSP